MGFRPDQLQWILCVNNICGKVVCKITLDATQSPKFMNNCHWLICLEPSCSALLYLSTPSMQSVYVQEKHRVQFEEQTLCIEPQLLQTSLHSLSLAGLLGVFQAISSKRDYRCSSYRNKPVKFQRCQIVLLA